MKKPDFLYHASARTDINQFEPYNEYPRFAGEGNFVFATPHLSLAAMFLSPKSISTEISVYGEKYVIFINATVDEYVSQDQGGAIYTLPSTTFRSDSNIGMGTNEWVSKEPVRPISKAIFTSSIEAMNQYGVEMYFVDDATMKQIRADPANAMNIVK